MQAVSGGRAGLAGGRDLALALEGNIACAEEMLPPWRETLAMDLGLIRGGYGWLFPKGEHLNLGVGGWRHFGPMLRRRLDALTPHFGYAPSRLEHLRGHHLPIRRRGSPLARGGKLLVGDAAGLIDPLSGEGIYAAIYSGRLASQSLVRFLSGDAAGLTPYARGIEAELAPDLLASQRFQDVFHLMPAVYVRLLRHSDLIWETLCRLVRGEQSYIGLRHRIGPLSPLVDLLSTTIRRTPLRARVGLPESA